MPAAASTDPSLFLSLQPYYSVTLRKLVRKQLMLTSTPEEKEKKPATTATTDAPLIVSTVPALYQYSMSVLSSVVVTNEYIFTNIEVDSPTSSPRDQVQQLLDAEDLVSVLEPTAIDLCSFQEALANALAQCTSALFFEENLGHSFLIKSLINYQACISANVLPAWPSTPASLGMAPDTLQLRLGETQQKYFATRSRLNDKVKSLLQEKFPGMLNAHFVHRTKYLPPLMCAREALEQIHTKVHLAPRATSEQMDLVHQVINRKYTPSVTGAEMHFYACETNQH